jgi:putative transcriptional regulator
MKYANKIKTLREKMVLTQTELANELGVSISTVNRWENSKFEPTIKTKRKIIKLYQKYNLEVEE